MSDVMDDDDWFADEDEGEGGGAANAAAPVARAWKVMIIDDDEQVHAVTRMVLADLRFQDRRLEFVSGFSAADAKRLIVEHPDTAVVLLDVVMEHDHAGLEAAKHIREVAGNFHARIVLRTGQPGQAPERQVIDDYEIDDYKAKRELTADALHTAVKTALRSYKLITALDASRRGLERVIDASATLMEERSHDQFVKGVILQLCSMIDGASAIILCAAGQEGGAIEVIAESGGADAPCSSSVVTDGGSRLTPAMWDDINRAFRERANIFADDHSVIFFKSKAHEASVVYIAGHRPLGDIDRGLLEVFCERVAAGFDNVALYQRLLMAQKATVHALGKLAEYKDEVTGDHVRRIATLSTAIAHELRDRGLHTDIIDDDFLELIGLASVLHDVGKVGIPDRILMKPGRLDDEEMTIMRTHAAKGGVILREAAQMVGGRSYLSMGGEIAEAHHEKFDGTGYPVGLKGGDIPLSGRIVALADVFDALIHPRPYKEAWPREKALAFIQEQTGSHFDPDITAAFMAVLAKQGG